MSGGGPTSFLRFRGRHRTGFTLIEMLVVIGILLIVIGLTLPAVQSAREAARRSACANNLRQMASALAHFEADHGAFPSATRYQYIGPTRYQFSDTSVHATLLPYLEEQPLFSSINFMIPFQEPDNLTAENMTAATRSVAVFLCPSDPYQDADPLGCNSYRANMGLGDWTIVPVGNPPQPGKQYVESGAFTVNGTPVPASSFRDGLSNTISLSEKSIGSGAGSYSSIRDWIDVAPTPIPVSADDWVAVCTESYASQQGRTSAGRGWMFYGAVYTSFMLSAPPNSRIPDCGILSGNGMGVFAARSAHPGGVNAAMADGSVRWFASGVNPAVWRSLGTRRRRSRLGGCALNVGIRDAPSFS